MKTKTAVGHIEPEILYTRLFKRKFSYCLRRRPRQINIVVPYIGDTPFGKITVFARLMIANECDFFLVTLPPNDRKNDRLSFEEAEKLATMGVNLKISHRPKLHSKIYQFTFRENDRAAFVGSSNFSTGGFENNDETVAFFQAKSDNDKVAREVSRISAGGSNFVINFWR